METLPTGQRLSAEAIEIRDKELLPALWNYLRARAMSLDPNGEQGALESMDGAYPSYVIFASLETGDGIGTQIFPVGAPGTFADEQYLAKTAAAVNAASEKLAARQAAGKSTDPDSDPAFKTCIDMICDAELADLMGVCFVNRVDKNTLSAEASAHKIVATHLQGTPLQEAMKNGKLEICGDMELVGRFIKEISG